MSDAVCGDGLCTKKATWYSGAEARCAEHAPKLSERRAHCAYGCGQNEKSSLGLPFFEYQGPGSYSAGLCANCSMTKKAHEGRPYGRPNCIEDGTCKQYVPRGDLGHDQYYCGCRGWD